MPEVFAFAGKGGVGKTTLSGLLVRYLVECAGNGPVLAVDADPNSNLNEVLGISAYETIGNAREGMKTNVPPGMTKDAWIEMKVHESLVENKGFDLLVMGRPEGQGCYCAANTLVKKYIDMLKRNYASIVVDNEAGMEHMSRLVTQDVDHLFVVSDATPRGLMTAQRILSLVRELNLNIARTSVIANRVREGTEEECARRAGQQGLQLAGMVHDSSELVDLDAQGSSVFTMSRQNRAVSDAYAIFENTINGPAESSRVSRTTS